MEQLVRYPGPGCVVEFLQGNKPQLAWVLEEQAGKLRLLTRGKKEMKLAATRLLPWSGPRYPAESSRQGILDALETHAARRDELEAGLDPMELWTLAQGEVERATIVWFAELLWDSLDADHLAALGHALLECKTHFRFQPPEFEIHPEDKVETRLREQEIKERRERLAEAGTRLFTELWEKMQGKRKVLETRLDDDVREALVALLRQRIADPEDHDSSALWDSLRKTLPHGAGEDPHLPLRLAQAWGLAPEHHNYHLDRAGYAPGDAWSAEHAEDVEAVRERAQSLDLPLEPRPFWSIDAETTTDRDDAFHVEPREDGGFIVHLALAAPALAWDFGSSLDQAVAQRAQSIYLPEATHHMMPEALGLDVFSLNEGRPRPALVLDLELDATGELVECKPRLAMVELARNLSYQGVEDMLDEGGDEGSLVADLETALTAANLVRARRLRHGAVIIERPDCEVELSGEGADTRATLVAKPMTPRAQLLISELMILANSGLAHWGRERGVALIHRTQDIALPKEQSGVYSEPWDIAQVVKSLGSAVMETQPRPHASLGVPAYSPVSSPLRRYPDLLNEAQAVACIQEGAARWTREELDAMLPLLNARLEAVGPAQRFRPRYWKLLAYKQRGDCWTEGVVTEETPMFVSVSLPESQIFVRGPRRLFGDKLWPGQPLELRLGKIDPLNNEIHILEAREF